MPPPGAARTRTPSSSEAALTDLAGAVRETLGDLPVDTGIPGDDVRAVGLLPLSLTRVGRTQRGTLDLLLRVLVVPAGPAALADLEAVLVALDRWPRIEPERDEPPLQLWSLLSARPRPAAIVRLDVPIGLPTEPLPLVLAPLRVQTRLVTVLHGVIVGPGDVPLPFSRVRAPNYNADVSGDRDGRFRLPVPADADRVRLLVKVNGRTFAAEVSTHGDAPVVIRCEREET